MEKTALYTFLFQKVLRVFIFEQLHNSATAGHLGIRRTLHKVKQRYFWCGLRKDVTNWCNTRKKCAQNKRPGKRPTATLQTYVVGAPMERISIDLMVPFPRSKSGNKYKWWWGIT